MKYILFSVFFVFSFFCFSQITINVIDFDTNLPVSGAKIYLHTNNLLLGISDAKGIILLETEKMENETVFVEAAKYMPKYEIINEDYYTIYLESKEQYKKKSSDAESIIFQMINKEKINNPHALENYQYTSYTKFEIDADSSSFHYIETPKKKREIINNQIKTILPYSMFFIAERAMIHKYDKKLGEKNIIEANNVSGIKKPIYEALAKALMMNELPDFLEEENLKFYRFKKVDSLEINHRKTYKVVFYLKKQYNSITASNGTLFIDAESYALVRYIGTIKDNLTYFYKIEREPHYGIWFTHSEYTKIFFPITRILNKNNPGAHSWATINTVYSKFKTMVSFTKKEFFGYNYETEKDFWDNDKKLSLYRNPILTRRELNTYPTIDSLSQKYKLIKKIQFFSPILNGEVKVGKINFDLFNSVRFNDFEGLRFQFGGRTNYDFSKDFSVRSFAAWATKDQQMKFGGGIDFFVNKINNGKLCLFAESDVNAAGKNRFREYGAIENIRDQTNNLSNNIYYRHEKGTLEYQQDFFDIFTAAIVTDYQKQKPVFNYSYKGNPTYTKYDQFATSLRIKFTPFVKYMKTPIDKIAIEDNLPYFFFNYTRSWNAFSSDFEYDKIDLTSFLKWENSLGNTKITANAGYISGKTTLLNLYEGFGVVKNGSSVWGRFELKGYNTFETIHPGSFFASQYTAFFLSHTFKDLRVFGHKYLYITVVYNGMIGNLEHWELHSEHKFSVPEKYYQEVGIEFNKLISIFGIGAYYRLGTYHTGNFDNNLYLKLTYTLFK